ncbi:MAG: hypothetical protein ACXWPP_15425 [Ktedonobacteraceae bacterium]
MITVIFLVVVIIFLGDFVFNSGRSFAELGAGIASLLVVAVYIIVSIRSQR